MIDETGGVEEVAGRVRIERRLVEQRQQHEVKQEYRTTAQREHWHDDESIVGRDFVAAVGVGVGVVLVVVMPFGEVRGVHESIEYVRTLYANELVSACVASRSLLGLHPLEPPVFCSLHPSWFALPQSSSDVPPPSPVPS